MSKSECYVDQAGSWIWKDNDAREPNLILFIHGYTGSPDSTWMRFPHLLRQVGQGFETGFEVASFGYETSFLSNFQDTETIAQLLLSFLDAQSESNQAVFIIAHSLGGVVARRLLVDSFSNPYDRKIFDRIKQVHFVGVPHHGAFLAPKQLDWFRKLNPLAAELRADSPLLLQTLRDWSSILDICLGNGIPIPLLCNYVGNKDWLVPAERTIRAFAKSEHVRVVEGSHIAIAKPHDPENSLYRLICRHLLQAAQSDSYNGPAAEPPFSLYFCNAPLPPEVFLGREDDLDCLAARLAGGASSVSSPLVTVVRGWPGVGKTSFLQSAASDRNVRGFFPDGILWASLGQTPKLQLHLAAWGAALGTKAIYKAPSLTQGAEQLRDLLQHRRMLLIVDDVWETSHGELFRRVANSESHLLYSTREPEIALALSSTPDSIYVLPPLAEPIACELLAKLAPVVALRYERSCRVLVRDLECLPLAIRVAAGLLNAEVTLGVDIEELLEELREGAALLDSKAPADMSDLERQTSPSVAMLLHKSTSRLTPEMKEHFASLGVFAPKPATFDEKAMRTVLEVEDVHPIVRALVTRGLLEPIGGGRFQMHALLVAHAKALLAEA